MMTKSRKHATVHLTMKRQMSSVKPLKHLVCVCDLAALLGITESAVSHQLRLLRTLRLVKNRREGTILYYRLADDHVSELVRIALEHISEPR